MKDLVNKIAADLQLNSVHAQNAIKLLFEEECTIPFVARYRKEATGSMDELNLRELRDRYSYGVELEATKSRYLKVVEEYCKMRPELATKLPEIRAKFNACTSKQELEDLYLPFKPKRKTRAQAAKEKGLEPLLEKILAERASIQDLSAIASNFITPADLEMEAHLRVNTPDEALKGAGDILAERIHEDAAYRQLVRQISHATGQVVSQKWEHAESETNSKLSDPVAKPSKKKIDPTKYENYFNYREPIHEAASHRVMAVRRGEAEKVLKVSLEVDSGQILRGLEKEIISSSQTSNVVAHWLQGVIADAYRRLMAPSIETELRLELKNRAEEDAIKVFSTNLEKLLLLPPIPGKTVMGIDPGLRTGSKLAVVSETGKLLAYNTIYPTPNDEQGSKPQTQEAMRTLANMLQQHDVKFIAIGNGTGSREIDQLVIKVIKDQQLKVKRLIVNEAGASVYSTDDIAREEFPELDPTIRSAVSIARRLQDPLAELVKVDPRSIGVGQYQHDCNVIKLNRTLKETVESCVNRVGVNLNTASYKLLSYVSGIGPSLARTIVSYRDQNGVFQSREQIKEVNGFGPKAFEQAAGFLRVPSSSNVLDNSAVHPERYAIVEKIATELNMPIADLMGKKETIEAIPLEKYVSPEIGMPTLIDISQELLKPGRDPRDEGSRLTYSDEVTCIEDLKIGMKLKGTVSNVTNFGAFVDIGVHQDGLVHISELSQNFVRDPASVVSVGDVLEVFVLDVDLARRRISLSCKTPSQAQGGQRHKLGDKKTLLSSDKEKAAKEMEYQNTAARTDSSKKDQQKGKPHKRSHLQAAKGDKHYSVDDLLSKFNTRL